MNGYALENGDTQNLENFVEAALELEFLLEDSEKYVDGDGDPDLGLHRGTFEEKHNQPDSIGKEASLMKKLKGTFAVMVTPFKENEDLDEKGLRENIGWYLKEGIHGVICNGSTSEFANLFKEERKRAIDITMDEVKGADRGAHAARPAGGVPRPPGGPVADDVLAEVRTVNVWPKPQRRRLPPPAIGRCGSLALSAPRLGPSPARGRSDRAPAYIGFIRELLHAWERRSR